MVIRTRFHRLVQAVMLYCMAAAAIAYFGFHAYHGDHGMQAKRQLLSQIDELRSDLQTLRREKAEIERRVAVLRPASIDPDMLDQRAREVLNYAHPHDLVFVLPQR
jgi:cell division protein FtsB